MRGDITHVVNSPTLLEAAISPTTGGRLLRIYRSLIVSANGRLFRPVKDLLDQGCLSEGITRKCDDEDMAGGAAEYVVVKIWDVCPGNEVDHTCRVMVPESRGGGEPARLQIGISG